MPTAIPVEKKPVDVLTDEEIVARVLKGEIELFEMILRRYNQVLYRTVRSVLRNDTEAEDAMQEAYVKAYSHLHQFAGKSKFSTWLIKIGLYEAFARTRKMGRIIPFRDPEDLDQVTDQGSYQNNPEGETLKREMSSVLEHAIDSLPEESRVIFVLRQIEGLSTLDTAKALNVSEEAVKSRLFRANRYLRKSLIDRFGDAGTGVFHFMGERCDRMVQRVMHRILQMKKSS